MLPGERDLVILNLLEQQGVITVPQLCSHCNCSPQTARRDLQRLEDRHLLVRTHGGAVPIVSPTQPIIRLNGNRLMEARTALVDRADVLIVTPSETAATRLLVERAQRAGVPIIAESHHYPKATTLVAINDYQAGGELGRWVASYSRRQLEGHLTILDVSAPMSNTDARSRGFADGLREIPTAAKTVLRVDGQGLRELARRVALDALTVHPEINVIFGINDDSALGALDAYRALGLDESKLLVVSFGFEGRAAKDLLEQAGPYKAGVAMFPELVGRICIDAAICAYHGCPLPEHIFTPFVAPYDSQLITLTHAVGQRISYHTCGGMMPILEDIAAIKPDAMETFTPPDMGGDTDLAQAKARIGDKVCMIGGFDQFHHLVGCTEAETRAAVRRCFEAAGANGGFILSASDHFFDADPNLIKAYAEEASQCVY